MGLRAKAIGGSSAHAQFYTKELQQAISLRYYQTKAGDVLTVLHSSPQIYEQKIFTSEKNA